MKRDDSSICYFFSANYSGKPMPSTWRPNIDIYETDNDVVVALEVPGVRPEDLVITQLHDRLMVRGVRHAQIPSESKRFHQIEIVCGEFEKEVVLSPPLQGAPVTATLALGILSIKISKKAIERDQQERTIPIEAAK